jgi:hypothetical protein
MLATHVIYLIVISFALAYAAMRLRRSVKGPETVDSVSGFRPRIGFSASDGMQSISLLLENESPASIWVEEIEIVLRNLVASHQATEPPCHESLRIRQLVGPGDALPISLAGAIYKAAGKPQREYSCGLSSVLRFRVGENSFEQALEDSRIHMIGLTASGIRRELKRTPALQPAQQPEEPHGIAAFAAKSK